MCVYGGSALPRGMGDGVTWQPSPGGEGGGGFPGRRVKEDGGGGQWMTGPMCRCVWGVTTKDKCAGWCSWVYVLG